jgi:hypothetical protein
MEKNARDKIPKSGAKRHPRRTRVKSPPPSLSDVPGVVSVRLDNSGRYFRCAWSTAYTRTRPKTRSIT